MKIAEAERGHALEMFIGVQDAERKHIAEDLHDSIGPMLAAIKINFLRMSKASDLPAENLAVKTESIIDESIAEIRNIAHRLMPKGLSSKGLISLLGDYFNNLQTIYNIQVNFRHEINTALSKEVQLSLYRVISELSLNAAKHSEARTIDVCIETSGEETRVAVKDDGKGFTSTLENASSIGLKNVKSRVEYLGGSIQLKSAIGKGTTIEILVPDSR